MNLFTFLSFWKENLGEFKSSFLNLSWWWLSPNPNLTDLKGFCFHHYFCQHLIIAGVPFWKHRHVWCYPLSGFEILWACSMFVNSYLSTINIWWVFTMLIIHKKGKLWITHITEPVVIYIINPPDCLFHFDYWKISHFLAVNQMPQRSSSWFQLSCLFCLFFDL